MANLPKIVYNFNENDASTIRDYSENGNDGVGTNITVAASSRVGNDAVFNSTTDQINLGNITDLNDEQQTLLFHGDMFEKKGSDALMKRVLQGDPAAMEEAYKTLHHTNPDEATLKRMNKMKRLIY